MEMEAAGDVHMQKVCGPAVVHSMLMTSEYTKQTFSHICTLPAGEMHFTKATIMETVNIFMRANQITSIITVINVIIT